MEQKKKKKKKSHVEEVVNTNNRKYEEETIDNVSIPMDNEGPGIDPYTKVIPPDMVFTYAYDDDSNSKNYSDSDY